MVSGVESAFMCQDVDKLVKEAQLQISKERKRQALCYNMHKRKLKIKVGDFDFIRKTLFEF